MEPNKNLFPIMKDEAEKVKIIVENIIIMLSNRIYIDKNGNKQPLLNKNITLKDVEDKGDNTFIIKANNGDTYAIKIAFIKISAMRKQLLISEFFKDYVEYKKIIVAQDYNNKIEEYVIKHNAQIFRESSLLKDLLAYKDQPKFELLSPKEMEQFKLEYNSSNYMTKKFTRSDPMTKYFALKKGDIVRIIRPSPVSGESVDYRIYA